MAYYLKNILHNINCKIQHHFKQMEKYPRHTIMVQQTEKQKLPKILSIWFIKSSNPIMRFLLLLDICQHYRTNQALSSIQEKHFFSLMDCMDKEKWKKIWCSYSWVFGWVHIGIRQRGDMQQIKCTLKKFWPKKNFKKMSFRMWPHKNIFNS